VGVAAPLTLLQIGGEGFTAFQKGVEARFPVSYHYLPAKFTQKESNECLLSLGRSKLTIVFLMGMNRSVSDTFGVAKESLDYINKLAASTHVILVIFGNPALTPQIDSSVSLIFAYEDDRDAEAAAIDVLTEKKERRP
jgi:hypothetical protein